MAVTPDRVEELKPCPLPWCDKSKPVLAQGGFRNGSYRVQCETCGCASPRFYEAPRTIAAWNTRVPESESVTVMDPDVKRRLKSVADTLETCGAHGIPIDFKMLAHDIREALTRIGCSE